MNLNTKTEHWEPRYITECFSWSTEHLAVVSTLKLAMQEKCVTEIVKHS